MENMRKLVGKFCESDCQLNPDIMPKLYFYQINVI